MRRYVLKSPVSCPYNPIHRSLGAQGSSLRKEYAKDRQIFDPTIMNIEFSWRVNGLSIDIPCIVNLAMTPFGSDKSSESALCAASQTTTRSLPHECCRYRLKRKS